MSAGDILLAQAEANRDSGKTAEAKALLEQMLASGEWMLQTDVMKAAKESGLSESAVRRARAVLPIKAEKRGVPWYWKLDNQTVQHDKGDFS
jgi:hypothetical protein